MQVLTISGLKGGTSKTTTAQALGVIAAASGRRTLLLDLDPQASLTGAFGVNAEGSSLADVFAGNVGLLSIILQVGENLYLAPAEIKLSEIALNLHSDLNRIARLKIVLSSIDVYDLIIIDCPPSINFLTLSGLLASNKVIIPIRPQIMDLRSLYLFLGTVQKLQKINPNMELGGILVTFYNSRLNHHEEAIKLMRKKKLPLLKTKIPQSIRVAEAAGLGKSIVEYRPQNRVADAYRRLAKELGIV
jgi:chromosome partitioning protein